MYTRIGGMFTMVLQDVKHHAVEKIYTHKFRDASNVYQNESFVILRHALPK